MPPRRFTIAAGIVTLYCCSAQEANCVEWRAHMLHVKQKNLENCRDHEKRHASARLDSSQTVRHRFDRLLNAMSQGALEKEKLSISKRTAGFRAISLASLKEARKQGKLDRFVKLHPLQAEKNRFGRLLSAMSQGVLEKEK
jgi:hypothetical protein